MVTADTVDQALVSGTLSPVPRPPETVESAVQAGPQPQRDAAEGTSRRRRRRRHRKAGGAVTASPTDAAPRSEAAVAGAPVQPGGSTAFPTASDRLPGDQDEPPVYSEGPEDEARGPNMPLAEGVGRPSLPRFADLPATEGLQGAPHRRRRRRRRHRGRGGPGTHPAASGQGEARSGLGNQRGGALRGGNGSASPVREEAPAHLPSEPTLSPPPPRSPREFDVEPPPAAQAATEEVPSDTQAEAKPKRRWWRRSFTRG
jgi:hypothetical protein